MKLISFSYLTCVTQKIDYEIMNSSINKARQTYSKAKYTKGISNQDVSFEIIKFAIK